MDGRSSQKYLDHIKGPVGSVILHILVVALALWLIKPVEQPPPEKALSVTITNPVDAPILNIPLPDLVIPPLDPDLSDPTGELTDYNPDPETLSFDPVEMSAPDLPDSLDGVDDVPSILIHPEFRRHRNGEQRKAKATHHAGPWAGPSERAVQKALQWLKDQQQPDGSWEKDRAAMTGLAILTYLAHDERPGKEPYGDTVEKAIRYLLEIQQADGSWGREYSHAIATYAMGEAFGMTRIPELKPSLERAVARMIDGQQAGGGWDYHYAQGVRRDTSVAGWHIQALKAAKLAGCDHPGIEASLARAAQDLESVFDSGRGGFSYSQPGAPSLSMTGVGTVCFQLMGQGTTPMITKSLRFLNDARCEWTGSEMHAPLYTWYYVTQARFHQGGMAWDRWNTSFSQTLTENQKADGRWDFPVNDAGAHEHGATQGPVYSTTLSALMLQVYHRVLTTFTQQGPDEENTVEDEEEVLIRVS